MKKKILHLFLALCASSTGVWADDYVAQIGSTKYTSFVTAFNSATSNQTITLLKDVTLTDKADNGSKITLDLNGYKIYKDGNAFDYLNYNAGTTLTITDSSEGKTGAVYCNIYLAYDNRFCGLDVSGCKMLGSIGLRGDNPFVTTASGYGLYLDPNTLENSTLNYTVALGSGNKSGYAYYDGRSYSRSLTKGVSSAPAIYTRSVTLPVSTNSAFGTILLPFVPTSVASSNSTVSNSITYYQLCDQGAPSGSIYLTPVTELVANTPYIFKYTRSDESTDAATTNLTFSATITSLPVSTPVANTNGDWSINGTYSEKTMDGSSEDFYYINSIGSTIYKAAGSTLFSPYHAWMTYSGNSSAKSFTVVVDGQTTGIMSVENGEMQMHIGTIYDLQGRKITTPQRGSIYVVNGKKIMY